MSTHFCKCCAYAYISTPADTTTTVAGDWYRIEGTFANEILKGFSIPTTLLTYDGQRQCFSIVIMGTFQSDTASTTITMGIYKNGSLEVNSKMIAFLKYAHEPVNIATCDVIELGAGDTLELRVQSDKAGAKIQAVTFTTTAKEI